VRNAPSSFSSNQEPKGKKKVRHDVATHRGGPREVIAKMIVPQGQPNLYGALNIVTNCFHGNSCVGGCTLYQDASTASKKGGPRAVNHSGERFVCRQPWKKDPTKGGKYDLSTGGNSRYEKVRKFLGAQGVSAGRIKAVMDTPAAKQAAELETDVSPVVHKLN
jgi:hypothetical protein